MPLFIVPEPVTDEQVENVIKDLNDAGELNIAVDEDKIRENITPGIKEDVIKEVPTPFHAFDGPVANSYTTEPDTLLRVTAGSLVVEDSSEGDLSLNRNSVTDDVEVNFTTGGDFVDVKLGLFGDDGFQIKKGLEDGSFKTLLDLNDTGGAIFSGSELAVGSLSDDAMFSAIRTSNDNEAGIRFQTADLLDPDNPSAETGGRMYMNGDNKLRIESCAGETNEDEPCAEIILDKNSGVEAKVTRSSGNAGPDPRFLLSSAGIAQVDADLTWIRSEVIADEHAQLQAGASVRGPGSANLTVQRIGANSGAGITMEHGDGNLAADVKLDSDGLHVQQGASSVHVNSDRVTAEATELRVQPSNEDHTTTVNLTSHYEQGNRLQLNRTDVEGKEHHVGTLGSAPDGEMISLTANGGNDVYIGTDGVGGDILLNAGGNIVLSPKDDVIIGEGTLQEYIRDIAEDVADSGSGSDDGLSRSDVFDFSDTPNGDRLAVITNQGKLDYLPNDGPGSLSSRLRRDDVFNFATAPDVDRVAVVDSDGKLTHHESITPGELGTLSGATVNIQSTLNKKVEPAFRVSPSEDKIAVVTSEGELDFVNISDPIDVVRISGLRSNAQTQIDSKVTYRFTENPPEWRVAYIGTDGQLDYSQSISNTTLNNLRDLGGGFQEQFDIRPELEDPDSLPSADRLALITSEGKLGWNSSVTTGDLSNLAASFVSASTSQDDYVLKFGTFQVTGSMHATSSDDLRSFTFPRAFRASPVVVVTPLASNLTTPLGVADVTPTTFSVNRADNFNGSLAFYAIAIGQGT